MISRIKGVISGLDSTKAFIEVNGLTYDVMLPSGLLESFRDKIMV